MSGNQDFNDEHLSQEHSNGNNGSNQDQDQQDYDDDVSLGWDEWFCAPKHLQKLVIAASRTMEKSL